MASDRPPAHRVHFSDLAAAAQGVPLRLEGDEANHAARVKRVRPGETVALFDGLGLVAHAEVTRAEAGKRPVLEVIPGPARRVAPTLPRVEVWCPPPKGDRLEQMIDQLSQAGVAAWRPLRTARAEREAFRTDRLERAAVESAKQCGRAWLLTIGPWADLGEALADDRALLADAGGRPAVPGGADAVLLVGPEGGWTPDELEQARAAGRSVVRFGPHAMRIETAALAGACLLLAASTTGEAV